MSHLSINSHIHTAIVYISSLIFFSNQICAQTKSIEQRTDAYLKEIVNKYNIPGVSAGIAKDGKIIWTGVAGLRDIASNIEVDSNTIFRSASISKAVTATAIMQLVEKGQLDLHVPIQDYLSDYPVYKKGPVTILHLLSHTSGIKHYKGKENHSFDHYPDLRTACRVFENRRLASNPGRKYRYTSYGYTVLGAIIESVTGQSFGDYLEANIFQAACMENAQLDDQKNTELNQAKLYQTKKGEVVDDVQNDLSLIYPGGGINMSATDLLKFVIAFENNSLISENSKEMMLQSPLFDGKVRNKNGALGWDIWESEKYGSGYSKVGGQAGTSALVIHLRDHHLTVAFLSNMARLDPIWEIVTTLADMVLESGE